MSSLESRRVNRVKKTLASTTTPHFRPLQEFYTGRLNIPDKADVMMKIMVRVNQTGGDESDTHTSEVSYMVFSML